MNESKFDYVDDPTVSINERGIIGVAWVDQLQKDVFLQIYEPDGNKRFARPVNVSRSPRILSWLPRMVISDDDANHVFVLWQEIVFSGGTHGGEIYFARSSDGGRTFSDPINLSNTIAGDGKGRITRRYWHNGSLDLAMGPQRDLYAVWTEYEGRLWFSRSIDRGRTFSDPIAIAGGTDAEPARGPALAVAATGAVYLTWSVGGKEAPGIRFASSVDRGLSFSSTSIVIESGGHADAPDIAVDGKGTVHLVFAESRDGAFQSYHIQYTRLTRRAVRFEAPRDISNAHLQRYDSMGFPELGLDGDDNIVVIWELFPERRTYSRGLGYTYSVDNGATFAAPSVVPGSADSALGFNGSQQGLLMRKLAVNRAGSIAVVNSTFRLYQSSRIWLFRGQVAGS